MMIAAKAAQWFYIAMGLIGLILIGCGKDGDGKNDNPVPQAEVASHTDINGDGYPDLVVGSNGGYGGSEDDVYVFYGNSNGIDTNAATHLRYDRHNALTMGDINGDGCADLIVSVNTYNDIGRVNIHLGAGVGLDSNRFMHLDGETGYKNFGDALSLDDLDEDGRLDLVVGAGNYQNGNGKVYIYRGTDEGFDDEVWKVVTHDSTGLQFGETLATGDINGDGYCDLAIGAAGSRKIIIYHGMIGELENTPSETIDTSILDSPLHLKLNILLEDINQDGYSDLIISNRQQTIFPCPVPEPLGDCGDIRRYKIQIYHGGPKGLEDQIAMEVDNLYLSGAIGAGDVNSDGFNDLAVGSTNKAEVYMGNDSGISDTASQTFDGTDQFGHAISVFDLNGDGFSDLTVSAIGLNTGQYAGKRGTVYLYKGSASGLESIPSLTLEGENVGDRFGAVLPSL